MLESPISPSPFPLSQMVGAQPSRAPHPRWGVQARAAIRGRACFCPHGSPQLPAGPALRCPRPGLQHVGPKPRCCPVCSLKPCPAKCETLPTPPSPPEGLQRLLVGGTVVRHLLSPSWSWDGYEGGTLICLTTPGQALSWPGCVQPS